MVSRKSLNESRMKKDKNDHQNSILVDDKNCAIFLSVLSDFLAGGSTNAVNGAEWTQIARLSRIHQVEGIVYHQCKGFMPTNIRSSFEQVFYSTLFYYKNREKMTTEIAKNFIYRDIPFFEVKGMEVAKYYPMPSLRTMGDSDIVVHAHDTERAISILSSMGFAYDHEYMGKEKVYTRNGLNIELHHSLIYDEVINVSEQEQFFSRCWEYVNVGFRQFMDLAAVAKNDSKLNWKWIEEKLYETKMCRFAQTCFGLIEEWFDIRIPLEYPQLDQDFIKVATKKIMNNGVFGFDDNCNQSNAIANQMRRFNGPRWLFRVLTLCERMFPGYSFLHESEDYKFLDGRPWLLPAAWSRRFYLMLRGRTTSSGEVVGQIMTPRRIVDLREEELKRWGLIE